MIKLYNLNNKTCKIKVSFFKSQSEILNFFYNQNYAAFKLQTKQVHYFDLAVSKNQFRKCIDGNKKLSFTFLLMI